MTVELSTNQEYLLGLGLEPDTESYNMAMLALRDIVAARQVVVAKLESEKKVDGVSINEINQRIAEFQQREEALSNMTAAEITSQGNEFVTRQNEYASRVVSALASPNIPQSTEYVGSYVLAKARGL